MMVETVGLRERTRRAVRTELVSVAMNLFLEQGYEDTTVEQISSAAGISRRSFFRYFQSKDEVLAESLSGVGEAIAAALEARPLTEALWTALRRAFDSLLDQVASDERSQAMTRVMLQSPSMHASHAQKESSWTTSIARALLPRLPAGADANLRAETLTAAALACLTTAQSRWVDRSNARSLAELLDATMNAVENAR